MPVSTIQNASLASGVPSTAKMPAGSVLQVVSQIFNPNTGSTTSTTPQASGVTLTITPTSATSKILVHVNGGWGFLNGAAGGCYYWLYRNNATALALINQNYNSTAGVIQTMNTAISWVDSPATTSATSYQVYFASRSGNVVFGYENGTNMQMILMEIAA
jgi:hypothetical protein